MGTDLERQLETKLEGFYKTFFERGAENRFNDLVEQGASAYPELVTALADDDPGERVDALVAMGRLFFDVGPTEESLAAVVKHSKQIREGGMGPERQAALFAFGRSGDESLIESFIPLLSGEDRSVVNVALFVLGYAKWKPALPFIKYIAGQDHRDTAPTAIWALGQIGDPEALELLLPMIQQGKNPEWVTGALGDIGDPEALESLVPLLSAERTDVRFLAVAAILAIVDQHKDRKVRRGLSWMVSELQRASQDDFPPVAVFALLLLVELGEKLSPEAVKRALDLPLSDVELTGAQGYYLSRRPN